MQEHEGLACIVNGSLAISFIDSPFNHIEETGRTRYLLRKNAIGIVLKQNDVHFAIEARVNGTRVNFEEGILVEDRVRV